MSGGGGGGGGVWFKGSVCRCGGAELWADLAGMSKAFLINHANYFFPME